MNIDKSVLVTGAARGIGRRIAVDLARDGYAVAVVDVDFECYREFAAEGLDDTVAAELEALGAPVLSTQAETTDRAALDGLVTRIREEWGGLNAVVCNAGGGSGPLDGNRASQIDLDDLDTVMRRNLHGTVTTVTAALPALRGSTNASVVTMGSVTGVEVTGSGGYAHYGISKAAVMHYTRYLAKDLAPQGIRANCVAPGPIATGRARQRIGEVPNKEELLARIGTPGDVSGLVRYLVSEDSAFMSGQVVHLYR
ncbi:SDR family NAD(P)-dependent oxidoreductase [Streptomyces sp. NPDC017979]|uniref:SDR family NAD(P)-dependent oxidoreductase n=1 Tax=Streptomyces sp. NPDC017979 TaxID=3365024 RepID=UPI00379E33A7